MALFYEPAIFEIKAKAGEAIASFEKVNAQLARMEKNGMLAAGGIAKVEKAAMYARTALLGAATVMGAFGVISLEALDKVEASQARLETAIKNTGVSLEAAMPVVRDHADAMTKLGFSYTETYDALAKITAATGSPAKALSVLNVAADLARAKQISLAEAGSLLAKASVGAGRGLLDLGIKMGATIPKQATFEQILAAIQERIRGTAKAFSETLPGKMAIARAEFQALEVEIGTKLVPYAIRFTDWIIKTAIPAIQKMGDWVGKHIRLLENLAKILVVVWAVPKIGSIVAAIGALTTAYMRLTGAAAGAAVAEAAATGGAGAAGAGAAIMGIGTKAGLIGTGVAALMAGITFGLSKISPGEKARARSRAVEASLAGKYGIPGPTELAQGIRPSTGAGATDDLTGLLRSLIQGDGVKRYDTTVNQNFTVYAKDAESLQAAMAKALRSGTPMALKQTQDAVSAGIGASKGMGAVGRGEYAVSGPATYGMDTRAK